MRNAPSVNVRTEYLLLILAAALKIYLLLSQWGIAQGFDVDHFLTVLDTIRMSDGYPSIRDCYNCYHPPLGFLAAILLEYVTGNGITAAEVLSSLSIFGTLIALRLTLKHIGILHSLFGTVFLYLTIGIPLFVFLSWAVTFETLSVFWTILALLISIKLLWKPVPQTKRTVPLSVALALVLALGMYTKFTGMLNFLIPFTILVIRVQSLSALRTSLPPILLSCAAAILIASPLYYSRYYKTEGKIFPVNMEWTGGAGVMQKMYAERERRDNHPLLFTLSILRIPTPLPGTISPDYSSFPNTIWFHTWKRPHRLKGNHSLTVSPLSNIYIYIFLAPVLVGSMLFFRNFQKVQTDLLDFGMALLITGIFFSIAQIRFAYLFPAWQWAVIKAKYVAPAILWIPFSTAYCAHLLYERMQNGKLRSAFATMCILGTTAFVAINHLIPIY